MGAPAILEHCIGEWMDRVEIGIKGGGGFDRNSVEVPKGDRAKRLWDDSVFTLGIEYGALIVIEMFRKEFLEDKGDEVGESERLSKMVFGSDGKVTDLIMEDCSPVKTGKGAFTRDVADDSKIQLTHSEDEGGSRGSTTPPDDSLLDDGKNIVWVCMVCSPAECSMPTEPKGCLLGLHENAKFIKYVRTMRVVE